jgi:c-di-GMP-binding flagellar brake protein YcgR
MKKRLKKDRREFSRLNIPILVRLKQSPKLIQGIKIRDISYGGIGALSDKKPAAKTVELLIPLPDMPGKPIKVIGKFVRKKSIKKKRKTVFDIGISFIKVRQKDEDRLFKFIMAKILQKIKPYVASR